MKHFTSVAVASFAVQALAFPHFENIVKQHEKAKLNEREGSLLGLPLGGGLLDGVLQPLTGPLAKLDIPVPQPQGLKAIPGDDPDHQFQAPGPNDIRGICPTLNALANHGYLSRDGITTFAEAANAVQIAYGFEYGLSVFLSALGLLAGGDLITGKYSIGGADPRVPNSLGPALGLDKHGVFEIDGSITRQDVHFGNNANFLMARWEQYVETSKQYNGLFGFETQGTDVGNRYDNSLATNPEFFAGPIWFAVSHAARVFVYEGLPNGTTQDRADYANIAPFFLDERFPEDWFRRGDPFSIVSAFEEAIHLGLSYFRPLGGNQGLNNFVPLDLDISKYTPAQFGCFLLEAIFDVAPGQLQSGVIDNIELAQGFVRGVMAPFFVNDGYFNCNLNKFINPRNSTGNVQGSESALGTPVEGKYPGVGYVSPDQPTQ